MRASASHRRPDRSGQPGHGRPGWGQPDAGQPDAGQPDGRPPDAGSPAGVLAALCASAEQLLGAAECPPARLRLAAAGVSVELEWPPPGEVTPAASAVQPGEVTAVATAPAAPAVQAAQAGAGAAAGAAPSTEAADLCIRAPMVGTFYHAPEPGSAPFVRPGDVVAAGQQVGILEVMKLMTPVEADRQVRVVEFLVQDAAAVEHGQPLISCAAA